MFRKIIIGLLIASVIGGAAFALLDRQNVVSSETLTPTVANQAGNGQGNSGQQVQAAASSVGDMWSGRGTILDLTTVGMSLALEDGSEIYVELGPQDYWQAQGITLNAGAVVTVDGFFNGTDYHSRTVTTSDGAIIVLRDEAGQPLWAGSNNAGENGGTGEAQIPADQWVAIAGTVMALSNNGVVLQTTAEETLTISFGRADFWQTQNITFAAGDAIEVLGFWQGTQFQVGQVTKTATDERILLRDPNGRPLWAGPGRGQGNANAAQHTTTPPAESTATTESGQ